MGRRLDCVDPRNWPAILAEASPDTILSLLSVTFSRISVALLLYRLFKIEKWIYWLLIVMTTVMSIFTIVSIVIVIKSSTSNASLIITYFAGGRL